MAYALAIIWLIKVTINVNAVGGVSTCKPALFDVANASGTNPLSLLCKVGTLNFPHAGDKTHHAMWRNYCLVYDAQSCTESALRFTLPTITALPIDS